MNEHSILKFIYHNNKDIWNYPYQKYNPNINYSLF
jgi:hypothetical protein